VAPPVLATPGPTPPAPNTVPAILVLQPEPKKDQPGKGPEILPAPDKVPVAPIPLAPEPFGPGKVRLPLLDPKARFCEPSSRTPIPSAKDLEDINRYVEEVVDPRSTLDLIQHQPRLMRLKENPTRTQIGDPKIAQLEVIGQKQISILGNEVGSTVLNLWFKDGEDKERILSYLLRVVPDPERRGRLEAVYKALAQEINHAFPDCHICLTLVGDKVVVSGEAKDVAEAAQILRVVQANAAPTTPINTGAVPIGNVNLVVPPGQLPGGAPNLNEYINGGVSNVINMIRIVGEQQVALKVIVAEINRTAARSIGLDFNITNNHGITVFSQNTGNLLGSAAGTATTAGAAGLTGAANLMANLNNGKVALAINALRQMHYAKLLAEPKLTALNGQTASFQAGGSFPVPVVTGATATGLQGVQYVPFGVQVQFTPIITDRDRIRLQVSAEVSATTSVNSSTINGAGVPGIDTRNFQSVVELREGETLAVAGLIQQNNSGDANRVPFFGDIPILGRLASFDSVAAAEKELVILVTPELVHPLSPKEVPALPGSDIWEPGDLEFYLWGRLESYRPVDYRSPVRTDLHKMLQYRECEEKYIFGPSGHSDSPAPTHGPAIPNVIPGHPHP
jgi:pilus assembly protein CpaC